MAESKLDKFRQWTVLSIVGFGLFLGLMGISTQEIYYKHYHANFQKVKASELKDYVRGHLDQDISATLGNVGGTLLINSDNKGYAEYGFYYSSYYDFAEKAFYYKFENIGSKDLYLRSATLAKLFGSSRLYLKRSEAQYYQIPSEKGPGPNENRYAGRVDFVYEHFDASFASGSFNIVVPD